VLLKVGENLSTDEIMPAGTRVLPFRSNIPRIAESRTRRTRTAVSRTACGARQELCENPCPKSSIRSALGMRRCGTKGALRRGYRHGDQICLEMRLYAGRCATNAKESRGPPRLVSSSARRWMTFARVSTEHGRRSRLSPSGSPRLVARVYRSHRPSVAQLRSRREGRRRGTWRGATRARSGGCAPLFRDSQRTRARAARIGVACRPIGTGPLRSGSAHSVSAVEVCAEGCAYEGSWRAIRGGTARGSIPQISRVRGAAGREIASEKSAKVPLAPAGDSRDSQVTSRAFR
jgi:hypothetical protein